jgi:hypothetical protein
VRSVATPVAPTEPVGDQDQATISKWEREDLGAVAH